MDYHYSDAVFLVLCQLPVYGTQLRITKNYFNDHSQEE